MSKLAVFTSASFLFLSALSYAAAGQPKDWSFLKQDMHFDVYAGGVHAVKADMVLDYSDKGRYRMFFEAQTRGLLGSIVPWTGTFESVGWAEKNGNRIVERHESIAVWQKEREVKTYNYKRNEGFQNLTVTFSGKKPKVEENDPVLTKGTTDALTAMMLVMEKVSRGGKCEGQSEVYDGSRRYALIFKHKQYVKLEASRYNVYSGPAIECTAEVKPIAGKWHKKPRGWMSIQEQGRERGTMPTVWFAQMRDYAVVVPVRVRVKTEYGTLFMHMTEYRSGDVHKKVD